LQYSQYYLFLKYKKVVNKDGYLTKNNAI